MKFAELTQGRVVEAGPRLITAEEIVEFARRYDPQPFHVDPEQAADSRWGGLISSGWMTCAVAMELVVKAVLADSESMGSPGVDEIRWSHPVRPGDELRLRMEVIESRVSRSGRVGVIRSSWKLFTQRNEEVLSLVGTSLFDIGNASR